MLLSYWERWLLSITLVTYIATGEGVFCVVGGNLKSEGSSDLVGLVYDVEVE